MTMKTCVLGYTLFPSENLISIAWLFTQKVDTAVSSICLVLSVVSNKDLRESKWKLCHLTPISLFADMREIFPFHEYFLLLRVDCYSQDQRVPHYIALQTMKDQHRWALQWVSHV